MPKLTGEEQKKFLREKLNDQCHLLRKSIAEFASGDLVEGVRLAIALRVLVHETGRNKPLLGQLDRNYLELPILDQKPPAEEKLPPGHAKTVVMSVPIGVKITENGIFLNATVNQETYWLSILGKWWTRPSLILPGLGGFSRKEIVLGLADKEGGSHVDVELPSHYQQLLASKKLQIGWDKQSVSPINLSRFMAAQAAVELLDCLDRNFPEISRG